MISNFFNKFRRITSNQLYFPEIDGIRFLAIVLVILFHIHGYFIGKSQGYTFEEKHSGWLNQFLENGDRGVELFFVLSGFILCLPFAQQYISNGKKIQLSKYYLRRVTRLEPPYFIALTLIFLLQVITHTKPIAVLLPSWLASLIYSHDFIFHHTPLLTVVAWSLEIEIQFYIVAPFLFKILKLNLIPRRVILISGIITLICCQAIYKMNFLNIYGYAQFFLIGILLADFHVSKSATYFFNKKWIVALSVALLVLICLWPLKSGDKFDFNGLTFSLAFPFMIGVLYFAILNNTLLKRIFSYKFVPIIGGMCYSIYLLHYTLISIFGGFTLRLQITNQYLPNLFIQIALLLIPVLVISTIFYYFIERPFMSNKWMDMLLKKGSSKVQNEGNKE